MDKNNTLTTVGRGGLTTQSIKTLIIEHRAPIKSQAVMRLVQEFGLSETDVDLILEARAEYRASPAKIRTLMEVGFRAGQINGLYEAREQINNSLVDNERGITIAKLLLVRDTFVAADCDAETLSEIVTAIFEAAREANSEVSLESAIHIACDTAKSWRAAMLDTVLDIIRRGGPPRRED